MRWDRLFADLEAQAEAQAVSDLAGEVMERTRIEVGAIHLIDRFHAAVGRRLRLACLGPDSVEGTLERSGPDWLLVAERPDRSALVPLASVTAVAGLGVLTAPPGSLGRVGARLDLRYALRGIARDRAPVTATLTDATMLSGTIDRVGADFVDIAEHPAGEPRRAGTVRQMRTVPIGALAVVRAG